MTIIYSFLIDACIIIVLNVYHFTTLRYKNFSNILQVKVKKHFFFNTLKLNSHE